ncbi:MAG: CPBP family intramembrane glutamic endopeptidase [Pseudomonadota bacterium]|nr:CPBP family intramembrane glutamic endopeptidase [Pseudomonadota bacterium]
MIQEAVNAAVQLGAVLVISLVVWLMFGRKRAGFARYVGLVAPTRRGMLTALVISLAFAPLTVAYYYFSPLKEIAAGPHTVAGEIAAMGLSPETAATVAIVAFVKTALAEEILFRGLIAKRLMNLAGFWAGNVVQALLFASIHLLLFAVPGGPVFSWGLAGPMLAIISVTAMVQLWVNERMANGSIAPGWLMHGVGNAVAYPALAFL